MNILFFLTPKAMCSYIDSGDTIRQAMERMENSGYTALPVLDADGAYCGVLTEGDLLWALKRLCVMDIRQTEDHTPPHHPARQGHNPRRGSAFGCGRAKLCPRHRRQKRLYRHRHPKPDSEILSGNVL